VIPVRHGFWTKIDTSDGRREFLGWDCEGDAASLPVPVVGTASPAALYRCHAPAGWFEQTFPGIAGVERDAIYQACDGAGRCELLFPFHGRLVVLDFDAMPLERDVETTRMRLFLAAWQMLNRMHVDALYPRGAAAALPAARAQLAACRAVTEAAGKTRPPGGIASLSPAGQRRIEALAITCRRAARIAATFSASATGEAVGILSEALPALAKLTAPSLEEDDLYSAWITAVEASHGDSAAPMALALAGLLGRAPGIARDQPGYTEREILIQRARALVATTNGALPDETLAVLTEALIRQFRLTGRENEAIAALEEQVAGITREHGASHPLTARPLVRLGQAQRDRDNLIGLRRTAERLLALWRTYGSPADVELPEGWDTELEAETGFAIVQFQRAIARRHGNAAAAGVVESVIARMAQRLGATHPYVRAAQSGQTEPPAVAPSAMSAPSSLPPTSAR
jgi:hypothetical protein